MMRQFSLALGITVLTFVLTPNASLLGAVSRDGLLIEYLFETRGGVPVTHESSATGQIDDTGMLPLIHAIGSGGEMEGLRYDANVAEGIGSSFSLYFPQPENAANFVNVPMSFGDELSSITEDDFRVEAWFNTTDTGRSNLVSSYSGPATALNLELHTDNRGRIYVQGPGATTDLNLTLPTNSRDGQWHHLAGVRDGDTVELYYDGDLVGSLPDVAGSYTIDKPDVFFGMDGRPSGTPRFQGGLDDVRIYNSADTSSLVAEYLFEAIEGAAVVDGQSAGDQVDDTANVGPFHGEGSAATVFSTPRYLEDAPSVVESSRYSFAVNEQSDSTEDGHIPLTAELADLTLGDFALETWFKTMDEGRSILFGGWPGDTVNLELHTDNRVRIYVDGPSVTDLNRTADIDTRDGEWHHLVGQREDDEVSLYLDGEFVDSIPDVAGAYSMQVDMFLGRDSRTGDTRFDGQLDNTRFWGRALSEVEIVELAAGAIPASTGDFNSNGILDEVDIELLSAEVRAGTNNSAFDVNGDRLVNGDDRTVWVKDLKNTWFGDSNLDGEFNTGDLVGVFQRGKFEQDEDAGWSDGDWTGDLRFGTGDLVAAFQDGGFETGPRGAVANVPEPSSSLVLLCCLPLLGVIRAGVKKGLH